MHLPIRVVGRSAPVEVPFRLFDSFKFAVHIPGLGVREFVADLSSRDALTARVSKIEAPGRVFLGQVQHDSAVYARAKDAAESILSAILTRLGLAEVDGERRAVSGADALMWIAIAHDREEETSKACNLALADLSPVWRDRTEPAPKAHVAADILDSYYQQVQDAVLGEWEDKAKRKADEDLTTRTAGGNSEVAP